MTPLQCLKLACQEFVRRDIRYCLIGGHAASLYRAKERLTTDVDFAILSDSYNEAKQLAEEVIESLGFKPVLGFIAGDGSRQNIGKVCMVTSTPLPGEFSGLVDILLPNMPWVSQAVQRAQLNKLDFGFAEVPVITPEDLIVAKCFALKNSPDRFQDLDDLKNIFLHDNRLDVIYLREGLLRLALSIPDAVKKYAPKGCG